MSAEAFVTSDPKAGTDDGIQCKVPPTAAVVGHSRTEKRICARFAIAAASRQLEAAKRLPSTQTFSAQSYWRRGPVTTDMSSHRHQMIYHAAWVCFEVYGWSLPISL